MKYPLALLLELGRTGVGRFDEVWLGDEVVSSMLTLQGGGHWMCWLGGQTARGREISASFLALERVLDAAHTKVPYVNLGANAPGTGGAEFKQRLGAELVPIQGWRTADLAGRLREAAARLRRTAL